MSYRALSNAAPLSASPRPAASLLACLLLLLCLLPVPAAGAAEGPVLVGQVTDEDSKPVAGARVEILRPEGWWQEAIRELDGGEREAVARTTSDEAGRYRVEVPEAGFFEIRVAADGRVPNSFEVGPVEGLEVVGDAILTPAETVTVTVVDGDRAPVAGARVAVAGDGGDRVRRRGPFPTRMNHSPRQLAQTDEGGTARFDRREGETLGVTVLAPGYAPVRLEEAEGTSLTVELGPGETLPVEVRDADGEPVAGAVVGVGSPGVPAGWTGEDGRLALTRDPAVETRIAVFAEDGGWVNETVESRTAEVDAAGDREAAEEPVEPLVLTLPPRVTLTGRTLGRGERQPVAGAWVWSNPLSHEAVRSDSRGNFTLTAPRRDGRSYLRADAVGYAATGEGLRPGQAAGDEPVTLLLAPTVSASGRVVDGAGEPVAGAEVWSESAGGRSRRSEPGDESFTDAQGRFVLAELAADTPYTVHARQNGYAPGSHDMVPVPVGASVQGLEIALPPAITAFGRVVDLEENPVPGAEVTLIPSMDGGNLFAILRQRRGLEGSDLTATAGPDGGFELNDLPEGRFDLGAEAAGFAPLTVPGVEMPEAGGVIDLGTLLLEPGVRLAGRVVDAEGRGIEGARVTGSADRGFGGMGGRRSSGGKGGVETAPDGGFVLEDLARGQSLNVTAAAEGYTTESLERVEVPPEEPVTLVLTPASTVSGVVIDGDGSPIDDARVMLQPDSGNRFPFSRGVSDSSDEGGRFRVEGVAPGRLVATVTANGFLRFEERGLEVAPGEDLDGLRFELERGHTVTGRVYDDSGRPLPEARVELVRQSDARLLVPRSSATADADGVYELTGVPAGEHSLASQHEGFVRQVRDLTVVEGENRLDFRLRPGLAVSGRVVDETGAPVDGAEVALVGHGSMPGLGRGTETSDEAGAFRIEGVEPGSYRLMAQKSGFAATTAEEPVEVTAAPVTGLEVRLERGAVVRGRLLGAELTELAGAQVMAGRFGQRTSMPVMAGVDYEGRFRLEGVTEGEWTLMAILGDGQPAGQEQITVEPGQREVVVDLDLGADKATVRGRVLLGGEAVSDAFVVMNGRDTSSVGYGRTDHRGEFEVRGLEDGTYDLQVQRLGGGQGHQRSVEVQGDTELELDIPASTVEGVVLAGGEPLEGASVRIERADGARGFQLPTITDRAGRFRIPSVPAGTYRLRGEAEGHAPGETEVTVEEGLPAAGLEIRLERAAGLELTVTDPYGGVPARITVAALDPTQTVSPADDPLGGGPAAVYNDSVALGEGGRVRLDGLPAGRWSLLVTSRGTAVARLVVTSPGPPVAVSLSRAHELQVRVPDLADSGSLGRVWLTGADGRPVVQPNFMGAPASHWPLRAGATLVGGLPAGRWTVTARTPDGRTWTGTATTGGGGETEVVLE